MFGTIKANITGSFHIKDVNSILKRIKKIPMNLQKVCAQNVLENLIDAANALALSKPDSEDFRDKIKWLVLDAQEMRHEALHNGATSDSDPIWAAAALLESWIMARSGSIGVNTHKEINGMIMDWLKSVVSKAEIPEILCYDNCW
jgi:hypothetical protein